MDKERVRAWWWKRQGLDGCLSGAPCTRILAASGWSRSVGGSNPYLTFWSRGGCSRSTVDQALESAEIHELPSARGCTHVVPADECQLALQAAAPFSDNDMRVARKLDVTDAEIDTLCMRVLDALRPSPLDPDGIRTAVGDAARSLGPEGAKKGISTTLPLALGKLQATGEIRRTPTNGRLDQQRYKYAIWGLKIESREGAFTELARKYFRWIGPATIAEFQWFSGLGAKAAKEAVEPLKLTSYHGRYMLPDDLDEMLSMKVPDAADYKLVGSLDSITLLRRDVRDLVAGEDATRITEDKDLSANAILDRGRLVGLWEYDPETESIVWTSFVCFSDELRHAVRQTEDFIRGELGDVRSYSLDSPRSRKPRIEALRGRA